MIFLFFSFSWKILSKQWTNRSFLLRFFFFSPSSYESQSMKKKRRKYSLLKSIIMGLMNLMLSVSLKRWSVSLNVEGKNYPVWWVFQPSFSKCQLLPLHRLTERGEHAFLCHINRASLWMGFLYRVRGIRGDISQAPFNTKLGLNHCDRRPCSNRSFSHV